MVLDIGRVCVKIAGRDAGQVAVVVDILDSKTVVVDGQVRRRKCNPLHLEPSAKSVQIEKGASHNHVVSALKTLGIDVVERKTRQQKAERPLRQRKAKEAPAPRAKPAAQKPAAPKAAKPVEKTAAKKASSLPGK